MKKEFIKIKAAFTVENQPNSPTLVYIDHPCFNYAEIVCKKMCDSIGVLKQEVKTWLESNCVEPHILKTSTELDSGCLKLVKIDLPPSGVYLMNYRSIHHVDER